MTSTDRPLRFAITEPTALDPFRAQEMMGITLTKALFDGLLRLDEAATTEFSAVLRGSGTS